MGSGKASRAKGVRAEREVADLFDRAGFAVRPLENTGDHLCIRYGRDTLHTEVKRQERARPLEWSRQAESEAPEGTVPLVVWRPSREPWRVTLRLDDFLGLIA